MDGGSNDGFYDVIEKYKDITKFWKSSRDSGQSAAIIEGWKKINGDILTWINADDYYFPNALEIVGKTFEQNPDIDVVYGDAIHVDAEGAFVDYFPAIRNFDSERLKIDCFICQPSSFIRKSAYDKVKGIQAKLKYTMDWDLWCQLNQKGAKFQYIKVPLSAVRYYKGTKTLTHSIRRYQEIFKIERNYAKRKVPLSVLGADYYGLTLSKRKNFLETVYMLFYKNLRRTKKLLYRNNRRVDRIDIDSELYGIERWGGSVKRQCIVHIPWYSMQKWKKLIIHTEAKHDRFHIYINNRLIAPHIYREGKFYIDLDEGWQPHLKIKIQSKLKNDVWRLKRIYCK
jgi:glycosyltransferase involved in cell wall biosynthesis